MTDRKPVTLTLRLPEKGARCEDCLQKLISPHVANFRLEWHEVDEKGKPRGGLQARNVCWRALVALGGRLLGEAA